MLRCQKVITENNILHIPLVIKNEWTNIVHIQTFKEIEFSFDFLSDVQLYIRLIY